MYEESAGQANEHTVRLLSLNIRPRKLPIDDRLIGLTINPINLIND